MKYTKVFEESRIGIDAVRLQGIGIVKARKVTEFKIGDTMLWNYGSTSIFGGFNKISKSFVWIKETIDSKEYERKVGINRLIAFCED
jgi:hypothetical protein